MTPTPRIAIALLAAAIAACASTPPVLVALPAPAQRAAVQRAAQTTGAAILLRPVVLPGYLENYPVVTGRAGSTLIVSKDTEWAEPFRDAVARVLRDALSQRLGAARVLIAGDGRVPDADLSTEFLALNPEQGVLRLDARWAFACTAHRQHGNAGRTILEVPLEGTTATDVAAATTKALERLADVLAAQAECGSGKRPG
jgi:uncharacterized lipoprotein YmbA